ncbi:MAG TPA: family 78 glycoside hydrolase catalytic domain, partial [Sunxiuqinia sp.]|nr:family 78 glycoside hydrolase catalytic domain [Sunxiuqinia sp.]
MKQTVFLFMLLTIVFSCKTVPQQVKVDQLSCNYFTNPLGVESQNPELSWIIQSDQNDVKQSAYKILVADNETVLAKDSGNVWDSGKVGSDQSIRIPYGGPALQAGAKYFWKVKVWGQSGSESEWSPVNYWQMGLLNVSEWDHAQWLGYEAMAEGMRIVPGEHGFGNDLGKKGKRRPVIPYFRRQFDLTKNIASATLYISGVGQYDAYLNGSKIGDAFLTPGWTDYDKTVFYDTYDVTSMLQQGENAVGVIVGNGFYNVNRERYRKLVIAYGMPKMICKLAVTYDDGSTTALISDSSWKTSPSPITYSSIYGGEDYDARKERSGWNKTGFDDSSWKQAILVTPTTGKLNADMNYPVKVMNTFEPQSISKLADDQFTYDFGQNVSGIVELKVKGKKGQEVRLIPAELVHPDSTANQNATGKPYYYTYTLKGHGVETWHPKFTYYGMRYVQVEGAVPKPENGSSDLPVVEDLKLLHTRNSAPGTGSFECSNELFNRINQLIKWAIKSNMQSVLT